MAKWCYTLSLIRKDVLDFDNMLIIFIIDMKRAFETVDRNILIKILEHIGISKKVLT